MPKAARVHANTRKMWRSGRVFIPIWVGLVALLTAAAAADVLFHLGWGYDWNDVLGGVALIAFGFVFWVLWNWMFKLIRWLNEAFHGPEDEQGSRTLP